MSERRRTQHIDGRKVRGATFIGLICLVGLGVTLDLIGVLRDLIWFYSFLTVIFGLAVIGASWGIKNE